MSGPGELLLHFDGCPYIFATAGVTALSGDILSHADYPDGATLLTDSLEIDDLSWTERLDILDGGITVDALRFTLNDLPLALGGTQKPVITYLFSRDDDQLAYTSLASSMTASDTTFTVRDPNVLNSKIPGVLWIEQEAINCSAINTGTGVVTVAASGRGYLGTRALKHTVVPAQNLYPEVWGDFPWIYKRRCILWFAEQTGEITTAQPIWRGIASRPELADNGSQWQVSADHIWSRVREARLGIESAATRLRGFDKTKAIVRVSWYGAPGNGFGVSSGSIQGIANTITDLISEIVRRLNDSLDAYETSGGINFAVSGSAIDGSVRFTVISLGVASTIIQIDVFGAVGGMNSSNINTADPRNATVELQPVPTAIVKVRREPGPIPISSTLNLSDVAQVTDTLSGHNVECQFFLRGEWPDESHYIEIIPTQDGYLSDNDSSVNGPSITGIIQLAPKDPGGTVSATFGGVLRDTIDQAVSLRQIARIKAEHWYAGLQMIFGGTITDFIGAEIDPRDWDFTTPNAGLIARTGGEFASREYALDGTETAGDLLRNEILAHGACLRITVDGKFRIGLFDQPTPNTAKTNIAEEDLLSESIDKQGILNNGMVVNSVTFKAPGITINTTNQMSQRRYGDGRKLEVDLKHLRHQQAVESQPEELAKRALTRLLSLFSVPRKEVTIEVPWLDYYDRVYVGSWITYNSSTLPNASGTRGASTVTAQVVAKTQSTTTNRMQLKLMVLRVGYGYSPCVRVTSISGATITCATDYVKGTSDYAQSDATDYQQTADDYGVGWFAAGYVCSLILRDSTTDTREVGLLVSSVNTAARTITMTASIPTSPVNWASEVAGGAIVDLRFDKFDDSVPAQQPLFAWVGSDTDGVIDATDTKVQEWSV